MKIRIISVGKFAHPLLKLLTEDYMGRLQPFARVSWDTVREMTGEKKYSERHIRDRQTALLGEAVGKESPYIALDRAGELFSSRELAAWLQDAIRSPQKELVFVIGGRYGLSDPLLKRAGRRLSLGRLTLTQDFARLLLVEQLYRAWTILRGLPYHS